MTQRPSTAHPTPIRPERVRSTTTGSVAFLPHRFLRDGFFASLRADELRLYLFLVLAADRRGMSFYHYDSICSLLECSLETYVAARNALIAHDLIAFDGSRFQVLSLPDVPALNAPPPLVSTDDLAEHDPAAIRRVLRDALR